jgi:hypothetical protein
MQQFAVWICHCHDGSCCLSTACGIRSQKMRSGGRQFARNRSTLAVTRRSPSIPESVRTCGRCFLEILAVVLMYCWVCRCSEVCSPETRRIGGTDGGGQGKLGWVPASSNGRPRSINMIVSGCMWAETLRATLKATTLPPQHKSAYPPTAAAEIGYRPSPVMPYLPCLGFSRFGSRLTAGTGKKRSVTSK